MNIVSPWAKPKEEVLHDDNRGEHMLGRLLLGGLLFYAGALGWLIGWSILQVLG